MKNIKKMLLAFLALSLVNSFAFAEDDNWPVDDEGYRQESLDLSSEDDSKTALTDKAVPVVEKKKVKKQKKKSKKIAKKKPKKNKKSKKKKENI